MIIQLKNMRAGRSLPSQMAWIGVDWKKLFFIISLVSINASSFAMRVHQKKTSVSENFQRAPILLGSQTRFIKSQQDQYKKLAQLITFQAATDCLRTFQDLDRALLLLSSILETNVCFSCNEKCQLIQVVRGREGAVPHEKFDAIERMLMRGGVSHLITPEDLSAEMARADFEN